ncbi:MAG: polysaccharide deacetylase family protein, partial [bacterium]
MFVPILAYHKIQNNFDLSLNHITPGQFEKQIKYLYLNGFTTISISEYIKNKSFDDKKVIITFDDGYVSVFEHALPILSKYKFTATIFVISKYVGDWNKWDYNSS